METGGIALEKTALMSTEVAAFCSDILKAIGHPARLRIIDVLASGERNVSEMEEILGIKQAIISQQLKILRLSGLVRQERRNGHVYYSLAKPQIHELLGCIRRCHQ